MNELIKITTVNDRRLVDARELHEFLIKDAKGGQEGRMFAHWIKERIDQYGFLEGQDYSIVEYDYIGNAIAENGKTDNQVHKREYGLTIDMAKELSMVENNDKGREARRYFIQKEKEALTPHGLYSPSKKELAQWVIEQEEAIEQLKLVASNQDRKISQLKPKAELLDQIMDDETMVDIGQTAKILGLPYGRNILFAKLRECGVFFKNRNEPKQEYIERGLFKLKEKRIEPQDGTPPWLVIKVLVSQKGLKFISELFGINGSQGKLALIQ